MYRRLPLDDDQRAKLRAAVEARQYTRAEEMLASEIERQPKSPMLLSAVGSIFFLDGKYLNCAVAMKKAEAIAPLSDRDRFTLALSYIILDHRDWARPELEKLAASEPLNARYPYWLGRLDYDAMRFKDAANRFRESLGLDAHFMKAYDSLGLTYEALALYDDAIRAYEEGIRLNRELPDPSPWPDLNLATLLIKLAKFEDARKALEESLRYDSRFPQAHYQMGLLLEKERKDQEAIQELNLAVRYDISFPEPHYALGRVYQRLGDKSKADSEWATFQKLKAEKPDGRPH
ncbi:MAG: hypothetical protein DMG21_20510 [Acidobacteria bacterium]|nr:MAG: hypothetical protein DMG21_20510 [Acidobacteriota bacterium]